MTAQLETKKLYLNPSWKNDLEDSIEPKKQALQAIQKFMTINFNPEQSVIDELAGLLFPVGDDIFYEIDLYKSVLLSLLVKMAKGDIKDDSGKKDIDVMIINKMFNFFDALLVRQDLQAEIEYRLLMDYSYNDKDYCDMVTKKYNNKMTGIY